MTSKREDMKTTFGSVTIVTPENVTTQWLEEILDAGQVTSFISTRIGTGQVSDCYRLEIVYGPGGWGPKTVILKVAASNSTSRATALKLGLYEREASFYKELAKFIKSSLPNCYSAAWNDDSFSLVLSDAGPAAVGNDIQGATVEQARLAVTELGKIHGPFLRDLSLTRASWLHRDPINQTFLNSLFTGFIERFRHRMSEEHLGVCGKFVSSFDAFQATQRNRGDLVGLVHGDYRLDNMLFGEEGSDRRLTVVDWQTVFAGSVMTDFAYFVGCSLTIEDRRAHIEELLDLYMCALGSDTGMSKELAKRGLREQSFFGIIMGIVSPMVVAQTERGDEMFMTMMKRHCSHVLDLDALKILPDQTPVKPLLPTVEDEDQHSPTQDPFWNESWYFDLIDENSGLGVYVRLGHTPQMKGSWYTAIIARPGKKLVAVIDFESPHPDKDLVVKTERYVASQNIEVPLEAYRIKLEGEGAGFDDAADVLRGEIGEKVEMSLDLIWKTDGTPYQWRMTTRYEIPCRVSGKVTVGGETFELMGAIGQRDHSHGNRDWVSGPRFIHIELTKICSGVPIGCGVLSISQTGLESTAVIFESMEDLGLVLDISNLQCSPLQNSQRANRMKSWLQMGFLKVQLLLWHMMI